MNTLLFLIYGEQRVYHLELTYSILSAARFLAENPSEVRIVLAADARNQRPDLPVEHLLISPDQLHEWTLGGTYSHALKINVLDHALSQFEAPTVLVDSDTIFSGNPKELFERMCPGTALMHASEGPLRESEVWSEWDTLIQKSGGEVAGWPIGPESLMYNSGLLGLDPSDRVLLQDVKETLAGIRAHTTMFTAEQLAASLVLQQELEISMGRDLVEHYWHGPRAYFHYQMGQMFPDVRAGGGVVDADMPLPTLRRQIPSKPAHQIAARLKRLRRGATSEYEFAYRAYLGACSVRFSDPELANVWAVTALNMLTWGIPDGQSLLPMVRKDFVQFAPERLSEQGWMDSGLQKRWHTYWHA